MLYIGSGTLTSGITGTGFSMEGYAHIVTSLPILKTEGYNNSEDTKFIIT